MNAIVHIGSGADPCGRHVTTRRVQTELARFDAADQRAHGPIYELVLWCPACEREVSRDETDAGDGGLAVALAGDCDR